MSIFLISFLFAVLSYSQEQGVPVQLKLKDPNGDFPSVSGLNVKLQVLSPSGGCILREEQFSNQTMVAGQLSLVLGSGVRGSYDPNISLNSLYNNTTSKTGLTCVNASNTVTGTGQTYNPSATDGRLIRVTTMIAPDTIVADFNMRSTPYAIQAESVGGKLGVDILTQKSGTQLTQARLESLLATLSQYNNLQDVADNSHVLSADTATNATNATSATTAIQFTGALAGDVTGSQAATIVSRLNGVTLSNTAPVSGQVLAFDGVEYKPSTLTVSAPVQSVNGKTGVVILDVSDIAGAVTSSTALLGDVTGALQSTVVSSVGGKSAASVATAVDIVSAAATAPSPNTLALRDGSGNLSAISVLSTNSSTQNVYLFDATNSNSVRLKAPNTFSNYTLTFPVSAGASGQVLQTDGTGQLAWADSSASAINLSGDVSGTASATTVTKIQNIAVSFSALSANHLIQYDGTNFVNKAIPTCNASEYLTFNGSTWSCAIDVGGGAAITALNVSAPISSTGGTTPTLSMSQASLTTDGYLSAANFTTFNQKVDPTSASVISALTYTPLNRTLNLSDIASATVARNNLGLGQASVLNVGTTSGTVAAGDDPRFSAGLTQAEFDGYVASANCATTQTMYWNSVSSTFSCQDISILGDVSGIASNTTVTRIRNIGVSFTALANNNLLQYNGTNFINRAIPTCLTNQYLTFDGTTWSCAADAGAGVAPITALNVTAPISSTGGTTPTLSMSQASLTTDGYLSATNFTTFNQKVDPTSASVISALTYTPLNRTLNLSDLTSATVARNNLGLGQAAVLNLGSTSGTVAAGDDPRFAAGLTQVAFNAYVASANCTTTQTMYWNSVSSTFSCQDISILGDVTGVASNTTVTRIRNIGVSFTALANNNLIQYNGTNFINRAIPTCSANQYLTFNGTSWSCATDVGSGGIVTQVSSANAFLSVASGTTTPVLTLNVGTVSNTVAAGNDSRIVNAIQTTTNFSGDVSGTYNNITLNNTGVTSGTYGSASQTVTVTVDSKGRTTNLIQQAIAIVSAQVTDFADTVRSTVLTGFSDVTQTTVTATDSVLSAIGKLQGQLNTILNPATTYVSAVGNITTNSTAFVLSTGMSITPPAGTYQVHFLTSVQSDTNNVIISAAIFAGGTEVQASEMSVNPRQAGGLGAVVNTRMNLGAIAEVTVNGAQAIEARWNTSGGVATSYNRSMIINRIR